MKARISVTIDKELNDWLARQVLVSLFSSKSHGVERALSELKKKLGD